MPLAPGDLGPIQAAGDFDLNPLRSEPERLLDCFTHRPAKGYALFELRSDLFGLKLRVQFGLVNFLNRYKHFAAGLRRKIAFQLVYFGALAADDNSRARRIDYDLQAIGGAFYIDVGDPCARESLFQVFLKLQIFKEKF